MVVGPLGQLKRRIIKDVGSKMLWKFERTMERHSHVSTEAVIDGSPFPWLGGLEQSATQIGLELDELLTHRAMLPAFHEISPDQRSITSDDRWKAFFLHGFGHRSESNCARCPQTARALARIPGLVTAFFSILSPGKHIPKHRGVYKGLLRVHLGLRVPAAAERCRMEIDGTTLHWKVGEAFVFDDTYQHEVWNDTDEERVVLIVDVFRPLPAPLALLNRALVRAVAASPYVTDGVKNAHEWERRFEAYLARMTATSARADEAA